MSIGRLPDEILLMIFRRVDDFREMLKLDLVCRRWRKIMRDHGWKHVRHAVNRRSREGLTADKWVVPIGGRCGNNLVECDFHHLAINSNLMRLLAENLRALRHLNFYFCRLDLLDENVLDPFPEFGARLRSLTFYRTKYHLQPSIGNNFLRHFPYLRHICLDFPSQRNPNYANEISRHFSANLRSLYLNFLDYYTNKDLEQVLARVQINSPELTALYLDTTHVSEAVMLRISELKNLRFLHMSSIDIPYTTYNPNLLCSCLANLQNLHAFQIRLSTQQLSPVFQSSPFYGLVHLSLTITADDSANFEPIGLLAMVAPQLRSLNLNIFSLSSITQGIENQLMKIALNGNLEHLNVPCASFTNSEVDQLVRLCPNLHSVNAKLSSSFDTHLSKIAELRSVVADQWDEGTRKLLPLRIWIREIYGQPSTIWQDPFLAIRLVDSSFVPANPVLDQFFQDEVSNGNEDGGTPSFVAECYDGVHTSRVPKTDLMII